MIKCLKVKNKMFHDKIISFKEKQNISFEHENLHINDLIKKNEALRKKSIEPSDTVLKFTIG